MKLVIAIGLIPDRKLDGRSTYAQIKVAVDLAESLKDDTKARDWIVGHALERQVGRILNDAQRHPDWWHEAYPEGIPSGDQPMV